MAILTRLLLMLLCLAAAHAADPVQDGYVVWLHSYHPADWSEALQRGIRAGLDPAIPLRTEFMDAKRRSDPPYLAAFAELLRLKHAGRPVRAVIASDDDAARFAVQHREDIFGGAPVAWCGVNHDEPSLRADGHASGVLEEIDAEGTLELAFRLRPRAHAIHLICDDTRAGQDNLAALRATLGDLHPGRRVEIVRGLPLPHLAEHLAALPPDDVAFFVGYWRDGDGRAIEPDQLTPALRGSACPVVGRSAWMIGRGQLGGLCVSGEAHGRAAAAIVMRLLAGEAASAIAVQPAANAWIFDAAELARHGIAAADLPEGAEVRFQPRSLLREHPVQVAVAALTVVVLAVLVAALGFANVRRRRAEAALAAERSVLSAVLDQSMHFMGILDIDGRVMLVNQTALDLLGVDAATQVGKPFWETAWWAHDPELATWLRLAIRRVANGGPPERRLVTHPGRDGSVHRIDFSLKAARLPDGGLRLVPEGRDISELLDARDRLAESEARFRQLAEHIDAVFWLYDRPTDRMLYVSRAYARVWGGDPEELLRRSGAWLEAVHPEDRPRVEAAFAAGDERGWQAQFRLQRPDGSVRVIRDRAFPIPGSPGRMAGIAEDITELCRLEDEARHAQRLQLLRQLAGGVAHDFNNALAGILGNAELALVDPALPDTCEHRLRAIAATAARAGSVSRQLLAFSRADKPERRRFDLRQVVGDAATLVRPSLSSSVELSWNPIATPVMVDGDDGLVQNAILNLLLNARDAVHETGRPGRIEVECSLVPINVGDPVLAAWKLAPGAYAEVAVRDTGAGMGPEVQRRIFDPFFTTKPPGVGNGLGLAAVHGTATGHGGAVLVESQSGVGTTFRLLLPAELVRPADGSAVILVADDEPVVREVTCQLLSAMGHSPVMALDGVEAVSRVARGGIDLVILDMIMPRMDGREAMARIRALEPDLPVFLLTGWAEAGSEELLRAGASAVLAKPLSATDLARRIAAALSGHGS